jgi:hypothetical protein
VGSQEELFHQAVGDAVERTCLRAELMVSYADHYPYLDLDIQPGQLSGSRRSGRPSAGTGSEVLSQRGS